MSRFTTFLKGLKEFDTLVQMLSFFYQMKATCLGYKMFDTDFLIWNFITDFFPLMLEVCFPRCSWLLFNLVLLALGLICCYFFTYAESPWNFLLDQGLTCKNYSMGIGVMTVWKKLLANARLCLLRVGHHQPFKHTNPSIFLSNILVVF